MPKASFASAPVHWSKDFVEHLRTVHFELMAVAVGLAVLVFSSKEYNAVTALVQIEEIIDLKNNWSIAWMEEFGQNTSSYKPSGLTDFIYDTLEISWKNAGFNGTIHWSNLKQPPGRDKPVNVECTFPKENWYQSGQATDWSPAKFPRTLGEFKAWWGKLGEPYVVYLPNDIYGQNVPIVDTKQSSAQKKMVIAGIFTANNDSQTPETKLQLSLDHDQNHGPASAPASEQFSYLTHIGSDRVLTVHISSFAQYTVTRDTISRHFHNLHSGEFKDTFADLSKAADTMSDLPLQDIKEFIHDDAIKGPEVFEVFGMKFPAGQATYWGIILLLSIQLYFFTYLRQLNGKLGPNDAGWDVPWIGMDDSKVAQSMFFVSLVPLPIATLALLSYRRATTLLSVLSSDNRLSTKMISRETKGEVATLLLACVASLALALLCWKYRPQLITAAEGMGNKSAEDHHDNASDAQNDTRSESQPTAKSDPPSAL
jgi:hypothetical protein